MLSCRRDTCVCCNILRKFAYPAAAIHIHSRTGICGHFRMDVGDQIATPEFLAILKRGHEAKRNLLKRVAPWHPDFALLPGP